MERGKNLIYSNNVARMQPFDGLRTGFTESGVIFRRLYVPYCATLYTGYDNDFVR